MALPLSAINTMLCGLLFNLKSLFQVDISFYHGFFASLSVILVSELGDKTWFIAVIMSMRHSRLTVFLGAMAALGIMTVLSGEQSINKCNQSKSL